MTYNGSDVDVNESGVVGLMGDFSLGPSRIVTAVGASVMLIFLIEGLVGNLWVLLAILSRRKLWNVSNIFITSLCINDLLSLCLVVALIIDSHFWGAWTAGMVMCKLNPEFTVAFTGCSLWHTALIAIHRYIVVVHNNFYKRMSKRAYVAFVLVMARVIPVACTVPGFTLQTSGYVPKLLRCILLPTQKGRIISITIVQIISPCVIVVLCYALIFGFVYRISRHMQDSNMILQREIQITKMFGVIFLMILFGFVPYAIVRNADRGNRFGADIYVIVTVCYGMASCSSPLVYGAMSKDIRRASKRFLCRLMQVLRIYRCVPCVAFESHNNGLPMTDFGETNADMVTWKESSPPKPSINNSPAARIANNVCGGDGVGLVAAAAGKQVGSRKTSLASNNSDVKEEVNQCLMHDEAEDDACDVTTLASENEVVS